MASLASKILLSGQLSASRRLLHTSRSVLAIPKGPEREQFTDQGSSRVVKSLTEWADKTKAYLSSVTQRFERLHEIYYGKERDMVNYPPFKIEPHQPKVRLGLLPDSMFQAFYDKTGVLGPYILALGVPTFIISKEYWVLDPEGMVLLVGAPAIIAVVKIYGQRIKEFEAREGNKMNDEWVAAPIRQYKENGQQLLKTTEAKIQSNRVIFEEAFKAKREILDLQLEEEYRRRMAEVARTVERRMAYHVELDSARKTFKQQHLVQWVLDSVVKGVTPQQEKEAIHQCIQDLKVLSAKA